MSARAAFHGAHELYHNLKLPVFPVSWKRVMCRWRPHAPTMERVSELIDHPWCTGLAIALGDDSGGLIVRDFDDRRSYHQWVERHPFLAKTLPTVEAARGFHVYAISHGCRTICLPDGEIRGNGAYIVVPPSLTVDPPAGAPRQYRQVIRFPERVDQIPAVDLRVFLSEDQSLIQAISSEDDGLDHPFQSPKYPESGALAGISIPDCIMKCLPDGPGQRHNRLFQLARWLRAILPSDTSEGELRRIAAEWFQRAMPCIRTRNLAICQRRLISAWHEVERPAGCTWNAIVGQALADPWRPRLGSGSANRVAQVLRAAGLAHGNGPFPLDLRRLAEAANTIADADRISHRIDWRAADDAADRVESHGMVRRLDRGSPRPKDRKATIWLWTAP